MKKLLSYRQGDVMLIRQDSIDITNATPIQPSDGKLILAEGETTGHAHTIDCQTAGLFDLIGKTVLIVKETSILDHQEHNQIEVTPGIYWVVHQIEYQPKELPRRVMD